MSKRRGFCWNPEFSRQREAKKRGRAFDPEQAKALREQGWTCKRIAQELGITESSAWVVVTYGSWKEYWRQKAERAGA